MPSRRHGRRLASKLWGFVERKLAIFNVKPFFFRDFGEIFAELLPGNFAKLQPPDGQDLMDGLEVKVQLGTVWKQSLTELSGGQRCVQEQQAQKETELTSSIMI